MPGDGLSLSFPISVVKLFPRIYCRGIVEVVNVNSICSTESWCPSFRDFRKVFSFSFYSSSPYFFDDYYNTFYFILYNTVQIHTGKTQFFSGVFYSLSGNNYWHTYLQIQDTLRIIGEMSIYRRVAGDSTGPVLYYPDI